LMMEIGCTGVFIENSIFASDNPRHRLKCMVRAVKEYKPNNDDYINALIEMSEGTAE
ncbi:hypothetical protein GGI21_006701, partial [Coemansia aciculifera]